MRDCAAPRLHLRRVGRADAAGMRPVGDLAQRAVRGELGVRQREQMGEWCGVGQAKGHPIWAPGFWPKPPERGL